MIDHENHIWDGYKKEGYANDNCDLTKLSISLSDNNSVPTINGGYDDSICFNMKDQRKEREKNDLSMTHKLGAWSYIDDFFLRLAGQICHSEEIQCIALMVPMRSCEECKRHWKRLKCK
mmetsp:Transcript_26830/g.61770  ORF Transcript_26830/g.61770 Transcript_26830/m.61770 type:complete len:119 (-) Transcript_26830:196-552(-)